MKLLAFFTVAFLFTYPSYSQSLTPQVINSTGLTAQTGNFLLSWSVGEMATFTLASSNSQLTEGFLQPDVYTSTGIEKIDIAEKITCYPNPTHSLLMIQQENKIVSRVEVYNSFGSIIFAYQFSSQPIDLSACVPGIYFIYLINSDGSEIHTFKIIRQ